MAEVQKIKCKECSKICKAIPISLDMIQRTFEHGTKRDLQNLELTFLLKRVLVECQNDGIYYFVRM